MKIFRLFVIAIVLLLLWQGLRSVFALPSYILPSPREVLNTFWTQRALLWDNTQITFFETIVGLIGGSVIGMGFAMLLSYYHRTRHFVMPIFILTQAVPVFAIAPLLVIWLGYGEASKIMTTFLMIFFPVTSAFYDGLRKTPLGWLNLAKTMNAPKRRLFWHIRVPAAVPHLLSGLRIAAVTAPMGAIIGEWVGSSHGLGFLMLYANARLDTPLLFASLVEIVVLSLGLYYGLECLLKRVWRRYL